MLAGELVAKVKKIEIRTRKLVDQLTGGAYHSVFKGRGLEFSEVREYIPGDDIRDIDWNVTARTGTPYIKKYTEERELTVLIAVDVSPSGIFGSSDRSKRDMMIECAALLALSAIRNNDKVGLLLFSDRTELYLPPRSGRKHVLRLIRELVAMEPAGRGTDIGGTLESLAKTLKKRAVIFLISDFLDSKPYERSLKLLNRKHDLAALRILDEKELELPELPGGLVLEGLEDGEVFSFRKSGGKNFAGTAKQIYAQAEESCRKAKVDLVDLTTNGDPVKALLNFFNSRKGKH